MDNNRAIALSRPVPPPKWLSQLTLAKPAFHSQETQKIVETIHLSIALSPPWWYVPLVFGARIRPGADVAIRL